MMSSTQEPIFFDMETDGLYPTRGKIYTIQLRYRGKNIIFKEWESDEKSIIEKFYEFTTNEMVRKYTKFVGYNILEFDVEFLLERLHHQDYDELEVEKRWERFSRHLAYIDLRQLLGHSAGKLAHWKKHFTGDKYPIGGDMIKDLYEKGEFTKIEEYVIDELEHIEKIYDAIKKEPFYQELRRLRDKALR